MPMAYHGIHGPKKKTDPMEFGTLVDVILTDHDAFERDYMIVDGRAENGSTKEGKAAKAEAEKAGKILAKASKLFDAKQCVKNLMEHPIVSRSFNSLESVTQLEVKGDILGTPTLGYVDLWDPENGILLDLKTFTPSVFSKPEKTIFDRMLHLQLWMYEAALQSLGVTVHKSGWIMVSNEAPFHVEVWWMDDDWVDMGRELFLEAVVRYEEYKNFDPSVIDTERTLKPLHWMK